MIKFFLLLLTPIFCLAQITKKPVEILVIGTFHFNNPGFDVAKTNTFDIMAEKPQIQLEEITSAIQKFGATKIFVEWDLKEQLELDTLYNKYLEGSYFEYVAKRFPKRKFYTHNEIVQLAFKAAKKAKLTTLQAIDYGGTIFDYDSLMKSIDTVRLPNYKKDDELVMVRHIKKYNDLFAKGDLLKCLYSMNESSERVKDIAWYVSQANSSDTIGTYVGAFLASEWYRRNLYMLANIQKLTARTDKKIMVLAGSSHAAMFVELLRYDPNFKVVELKNLMEKK